MSLTKTNEPGRSMVEMLGVLAVIGVLSIGGIAGYVMAMNRHKANELMDGASKRAIVVMQQISLGLRPEEISLEEFEDNVVAGGTFTDTIINIEGGEFGVEVMNVEKPICELLANMSTDDVTIAKVSDSEASDLSPEDCSDTASNNTLAFVYNWAAGPGGTEDPGMEACLASCTAPNRCLPNGEN